MREVGPKRMIRFLWVSLLLSVLRRTWISPLRIAFLRICGARIGTGTIVHRISLINVDRGGFGALTIGASCFVGDEVLIDLAAPVTLEDHVTLATRAVILTHLNVGYQDHPLQARFPSQAAGVTLRRGTFVGAGAILLSGVSAGPEAFIGAASLVNRDVAASESVAGVPIRTLQ
jgi:acetyltransferase-like isoleucine patch superfamily enzyme